jgi:hypothetical protein
MSQLQCRLKHSYFLVPPTGLPVNINNINSELVQNKNRMPSLRLLYILSRLGVTYKTGFGLDDWIDYNLYIHNSRLQAITELSLIYNITLHRYTRTTVLSLH